MKPEVRRDLIGRFRRGEVRYLVNYGIVVEGSDIPEVRVIVMARASKSRGLVAQMIGRGTRPHPDIVPLLNAAPDAETRRRLIRWSKKPGCAIIDLVGNSGRHKLVTALDALGGRYEDRVIDIARGGMKHYDLSERPEPTDMEKALRLAREAFDRAETEKRQMVLLKARSSTTWVNAFDPYDIPSGKREPFWLKGKSPSESQKAFLRKLYVPEGRIAKLSMHQATLLLKTILGRKKEGKCTLGQAARLQRYGQSPDVTFAEARDLLDRIARNGRKPPCSA